MIDRSIEFGQYEKQLEKAENWEEGRKILMELVKNIQRQFDDTLKNSFQRSDLSFPLVQHASKDAPRDSDLVRSQMAFYLDETNNKLMTKVRLSDGTLKSAEVNLT